MVVRIPRRIPARTSQQLRARKASKFCGIVLAVGACLGPVPSTANPVPPPSTEVLPFLDPTSIRVGPDGSTGRLVDGTPAQLSLRPDLQRVASRLLQSARPIAGAVLLVDVASGRLLIYEQFTRGTHPSYDVPTTDAPTASLFKLVTTAALFEHTKVHPTTTVCSSGGQHGIQRAHLLPPAPHEGRCAPFGTALGHSRNAVYAQLATEHLMRNDLLATAERLGFNAELPFDLPARVGTLDLPYNDLEFARAAAGFQNSSFTPLGATHLSLAVALGGRAGRLRLVERARDYEAPAGLTTLGTILSPEIARRLSRMMEVTVHSGTSLEVFSNPQGTSYLGPIRVAGKTGTLKVRPGSPTTSWFTGFAPSRKPEVVVTVLLRNDEVWRNKANEVARDVLRAYFDGRSGVTPLFATATR